MSVDDGKTWIETPLSEPFDLVQGPKPHGPLYLGNYFEVQPLGSREFAVAFAVAPPLSNGPSDLHLARIVVKE